MIAALLQVLMQAYLLSCTAQTSYPFNYSNTHGDHMVLQRDKNATLWGFGTLFAPISITILSNYSGAAVNSTVLGVTDSTGRWRIQLPSLPAGGPYMITGNSTTTGEEFTLSDVLFGDVVICGGQSNMAYGMAGILNGSYYIQQAALRPFIRIYSPQYSAQNASQSAEVLEYAINWTVADPEFVPGFSAVCYLSAAQIYDATNGSIPMGLIDTSVGGTAIQLWVPPRYVSVCYSSMGWWESWPWSLSCWYNGMVAPLVEGPTDMAFFIWDQGENNVGQDDYYTCAFPLMIKAWREGFKNPSAPFYYIQLPEYIQSNSSQLATFRETQRVALSLPNTGMVVTADDGDAYDGCIHNRDKAVVGARVGNLILHEVYGRNDVKPYGPQYAAAHGVTNGNTVAVTITVDPAGLYSGLTMKNPDFFSNSSWCPSARGIEDKSCDWFAIQTSDSAWYNATAAISPDGSSVVLTATINSTGLAVVATRNGFADWPVVSVMNSEGLPLMPWPPRAVTSSIVLS